MRRTVPANINFRNTTVVQSKLMINVERKFLPQLHGNNLINKFPQHNSGVVKAMINVERKFLH